MQPLRLITAFFALILLAGCAGYGARPAINTLNRMQPVGSPFTRYLAAEYRALANRAQGRILNSTDGLHFARKSMASADGVIVMPETVDDWHISGESIPEMLEARADLIAALENGAREIAPDDASLAQSRFDCWVTEQQLFGAKGGSCKAQFLTALNTLRGTLASTSIVPPPAYPEGENFPMPVGAMPRGENVPIQQAAFMVFFDWDKYNLSGGAKNVLDVVAGEVKNRDDVRQVVVTGHTDTSGSGAYNKGLSLKRANAVRDGIISRGFSRDKIRVEARGETELLIPTADNVREPENRRAEITLE